jgi:hypothetical protein
MSSSKSSMSSSKSSMSSSKSSISSSKSKKTLKMNPTEQRKFNKIVNNLKSVKIVSSKNKSPNKQLYYIKDSKCKQLRTNFIPTIKTEAPISMYGNTRNSNKSNLAKIKLFYEKVFNIREDFVELDMGRITRTHRKPAHTKGYIYENKKYCEIFNNKLIATPELFYKLFNDYTKKMNKIIKTCDRVIKNYNDTTKKFNKQPILSNNSDELDDELNLLFIKTNNFLAQEIDIFLPGLHNIKKTNEVVLTDNSGVGLFLINNSWDTIRPLELIKLFHDFVHSLQSLPYYNIILDINKFDNRLIQIFRIYNDIHLYIKENQKQIDLYDIYEEQYYDLLEEIEPKLELCKNTNSLSKELKIKYNSIIADINGNLRFDTYSKKNLTDEILYFSGLLTTSIEHPTLLPYLTIEHLRPIKYKLQEYTENKTIINKQLNEINRKQIRLREKYKNLNIRLDTLLKKNEKN